MRKCFGWLFLLLLLLTASASAEQFKFVHDAYAGLYDRELSVDYECTRKGASGVLLLMDQNGNTLGSTKVSGDKNYGVIRISITETCPSVRRSASISSAGMK